MVKYFDSRFYAKVTPTPFQATEHHLIRHILSSPDPLTAIEHELQNEKSILLDITNPNYIDQLRDFVLARLAMLCEELKLRTMEGKKTEGA